MPEFQTVTKLQAAERQLRFAIRSLFNQADMIAVHTLTMAALGVLNDLAKHRGVPNRFRDNPYLRPGKEKWWRALLTDAQNFFKHADRDPEATFDFYPGATAFHIFEAVMLHNDLTKGWIAETLVFMQWFGLKYPECVGGPLEEASRSLASRGTSPDDFELFRLVLDETCLRGAATGRVP